MTAINQKEYLKKYLSIGSEPGKKKKRKKAKTSASQKRVKIIDDDIDIAATFNAAVEEDLYGTAEDAPQIVGITDDRPLELRANDYKISEMWKPLGEDNTSKAQTSEKTGKQKFIDSSQNCKIESNDDDYNESPPRRICSPSRKNNSPSRKYKEADESTRRTHEDNDQSPVNKNKCIDSSPPRRNNDISPRRRRRESDSSPPRRSRRESDSSPPRKSKKESDSSPVRRSRRESDSSPPRKNRRESDSSPVRKKRRESDSSPPRKSRKESDSSPPRKKRRESDSSPPRRNRNEEDSSPPRRGRKELNSPRKSKQDLSPSGSSKPKRKSRWNQNSPVDEDRSNRGLLIPKEEPLSPPSGKMKKTLDGKAAGLQNAQELVKETQAFKKREEELFKNLSEEVSGASASTVVRDRKTGKIRDFGKEAEAAKRQKDEEDKRIEKYAQWGKGLKQVEDQNEKIAQDLYEMSKPLARYADDEDLEQYLKQQEREGDPMLAYIRKKKRKKAVAEGNPILEKPQYEGEFMPNRYGIRPGHRWDGVDRSNGYEKRWFETINKKKAQAEETYKWNTEDM